MSGFDRLTAIAREPVPQCRTARQIIEAPGQAARAAGNHAEGLAQGSVSAGAATCEEAMTLDIRAGMFAVLRDGRVVGPMEQTRVKTKYYSHVWNVANEAGGRWDDDGEDGNAAGKRGNPEPTDIVATFATRAEALAYVADNPMNRELYPDGPDLAPAPVVVDWRARAEAAEAALKLAEYVLQDDLNNRLTPRVVDIAYSAFMAAKRPNDEDGGPSDWFNDTKPMVDAAIAKISAAILAAAKEPRHE